MMRVWYRMVSDMSRPAGTRRATFSGRGVHGIEVGLNARLPKGGLLAGGLSTGRSVGDVCGIARTHPEVVTTVNFAADTSVNFTSGPSASTEFCRMTLPFEGQTQVKLSGSYPLPFWGLETA